LSRAKKLKMLKPLNNQPSGLKLVNPPSKHKQGFQQELYHHKLEHHNQDLLNQDHHNQDLNHKGFHKLNQEDMSTWLNHIGENCLNIKMLLKIGGDHKCLHKAMV
jgi:hypothetical protein